MTAVRGTSSEAATTATVEKFKDDGRASTAGAALGVLKVGVFQVPKKV